MEKNKDFLYFIYEWKNHNNSTYEELFGNGKDSYTQLFNLALQCIPEEFKDICKEQLGKASKKYSLINVKFLFINLLAKLTKSKKRKILDRNIKNYYDFDGYLSIVHGNVNFVKEKENSEDQKVLYYRIPKINDWWAGLPLELRSTARVFFGCSEESLKMKARHIMIAAICCLKDILDNLCNLAYKEKNPLLLSGLSYVMIGHGLIDFLLSLNTMESNLKETDTSISKIINCAACYFVSESISNSYDTKKEWVNKVSQYQNEYIRNIITNFKGKPGRPLKIRQISFPDEIFISENKPDLINAIIDSFNEIEKEYQISYIKTALLLTNHLGTKTSLRSFCEALSYISGKDCGYRYTKKVDNILSACLMKSMEGSTLDKGKFMEILKNEYKKYKQKEIKYAICKIPKLIEKFEAYK